MKISKIKYQLVAALLREEIFHERVFKWIKLYDKRNVVLQMLCSFVALNIFYFANGKTYGQEMMAQAVFESRNCLFEFWTRIVQSLFVVFGLRWVSCWTLSINPITGFVLCCLSRSHSHSCSCFCSCSCINHDRCVGW